MEKALVRALSWHCEISRSPVDSSCFLQCRARVSGSHYHIETTGDHGAVVQPGPGHCQHCFILGQGQGSLLSYSPSSQPSSPANAGKPHPALGPHWAHPPRNAKLLQISISTIHYMQIISSFAFFNINHYHMEWVCSSKHFTAIHVSPILSELR